jgi:hypothetical protein
MGRKRKLEEKTLSSSQPTKKVVEILEPIKEKAVLMVSMAFW